MPSVPSSPSKQPRTELEDYAQRIEALAQSLGLDYYPVDFELAPPA
jgi:spore cortex formation protein SpoVR/YcgB (stage V sporulation)